MYIYIKLIASVAVLVVVLIVYYRVRRMKQRYEKDIARIVDRRVTEQTKQWRLKEFKSIVAELEDLFEPSHKFSFYKVFDKAWGKMFPFTKQLYELKADYDSFLDLSTYSDDLARLNAGLMAIIRKIETLSRELGSRRKVWHEIYDVEALNQLIRHYTHITDRLFFFHKNILGQLPSFFFLASVVIR